VWKVAAVVDLDLDDDDRDAWMRAGMPDIPTWPGRPYRVRVDYVAGLRPDWVEDGREGRQGGLTVRAEAFGGAGRWHLYPESNRWPQCSCCGEPMPCRAELRDRKVAAEAKRLDVLTSRVPGCCWACDEPITGRQKVVEYPGENLDLPGAPPPRFHMRSSCWHAATRYEERWIAVDPRNERVLTWPKCAGMLIVHGDGSSECRTAPSLMTGVVYEGEPNCGGHLTHDHQTMAACYAADSAACPRGCPRDGHPGCRTSPRPPRSSWAAPVLGD
jgi:hypothetical protein